MPPREIRAVGVDRSQHALAVRHRGVVGNGVPRFDLVSPPIGKARRTGARFRDLARDFVTFKNVLQRADADLELVSHAQHCEHLILPIGVAVNEPLVVYNFG